LEPTGPADCGRSGWLGIESRAQLFTVHNDLVQTTSILRHAVFVGGDIYNGNHDMVKSGFLSRQMLEHFGEAVSQLNDAALFLPLGPTVSGRKLRS
jgi:hypothetical protein